jgi:hypothetical protein
MRRGEPPVGCLTLPHRREVAQAWHSRRAATGQGSAARKCVRAALDQTQSSCYGCTAAAGPP